MKENTDWLVIGILIFAIVVIFGGAVSSCSRYNDCVADEKPDYYCYHLSKAR